MQVVSVFKRFAFFAGLVCVSATVSAVEVSGVISLEHRHFWQSAIDSRQPDQASSISLQPEFYDEWDEGRQSFVFTPFLRLDEHDNNRSHFDIREAQWIYAADSYELRAGIGKVYWGVTEANHLVDIINQTDSVEGPDGEEKLGQPMLKFSMERDWGVLDAFVLPYFRERTFVGNEGRLRGQPRVATELTQYESGAGNNYVDVTLRWSNTIGDWDVGIAHFHGTGRAPSLASGTDSKGNSVFIPRYEIIDQTSLDAQFVDGDMLWKLEAIHRSGQGDSFYAATGGFEYTFVGISDSAADLGMLVEGMYDERGTKATTPFNRDIFLGLRWLANDAQSTEVLTGVVRDVSTEATFFNLEASRRLGDAWKLSLQSRAWLDISVGDPAYAQRNDDYIEFKLSRYF